jgi:hypothetical protein
MKEYVDFISVNKELLGETVKDLGIAIVPTLLAKYFLYKHSLLDKMSTSIELE